MAPGNRDDMASSAQIKKDVVKLAGLLDKASVSGDETLNLSLGKMTPESAVACAPALASNAAFSRLDASSNTLGPVGTAAVVDAMLARGSPVSFVDISANGMCDDGAVAIGRLLEAEALGLVELDLHANNITDPGATALAASLQSNRSLTCLNLRANIITDAGAAELVKALQARGGVPMAIDMAVNELSPSGEERLSRVPGVKFYDSRQKDAAMMGMLFG